MLAYEYSMYYLHFTFKFNVYQYIKQLQSLVQLGMGLDFFQLFAITKKL